MERLITFWILQMLSTILLFPIFVLLFPVFTLEVGIAYFNSAVNLSLIMLLLKDIKTGIVKIIDEIQNK